MTVPAALRASPAISRQPRPRGGGLCLRFVPGGGGCGDPAARLSRPGRGGGRTTHAASQQPNAAPGEPASRTDARCRQPRSGSRARLLLSPPNPTAAGRRHRFGVRPPPPVGVLPVFRSGAFSAEGL